MPAPRVALVHDHLVQDGGAERVLRTLMKMWPDAPVYTLLYDRQVMGRDFHAADIRTSGWQRLPGITKHYKPLLPFIDGAFRHFDLSGYDIVISSASAWAKGVRVPDGVHVCYCHTPTRYLWSNAGDYIAATGYPAPLKWAFRRALGWLREKDRRAAAGVDVYVANSKYVARRIKRYYDRSAKVINPPVDIDQFGPSRKRGDYYLIATRLEPYKRVDLAIAAANELKVPLKVMGVGTALPDLKKLAGPTVDFVGRIPDAERKKLFGAARAFINPQEEDFGITVVEALASGTPVIAYGKGGAREIVDSRSGILYEKQTIASLVGAIRHAKGRKFVPSHLQSQAKRFSEPTFERRFRSAVDAAYISSKRG